MPWQLSMAWHPGKEGGGKKKGRRNGWIDRWRKKWTRERRGKERLSKMLNAIQTHTYLYNDSLWAVLFTQDIWEMAVKPLREDNKFQLLASNNFSFFLQWKPKHLMWGHSFRTLYKRSKLATSIKINLWNNHIGHLIYFINKSTSYILWTRTPHIFYKQERIRTGG